MGTSVSPYPTPPALHAPRVVPCPAAGPRQELLDRVRHAIRTRHYSRRTEQADVDRRVSASTQNQALSALLFLYTHVLAIEITAMPPVVRAHA